MNPNTIYVHLMFYTYICASKKNGTLYTGHTDDLSARMEQHRQKIFKGFTSKYDVTILVWFEKHRTRDEAFKRERQIKAWKRVWKLELIEKENPDWVDIHDQPVWPPVNPSIKSELDPKSSLG